MTYINSVYSRVLNKVNFFKIKFTVLYSFKNSGFKYMFIIGIINPIPIVSNNAVTKIKKTSIKKLNFSLDVRIFK